jgi:Zn-dependent protease with chaperone function
MEGWPSFIAHASHPDLGENVVDGRITIDPLHFHFVSETVTLKIPLGQLEISPAEGKSSAIFFSDTAQPEWSVHTFDRRILEDINLGRNSNTRWQIRSLQGSGELQNRVKVTLWVVGGFAGLAFAVMIFLGIAVRVLVSQIPPKFEQDLGAKMFAEVKQESTFVTDPKLLARVDQAAAPLLAILPTNRIHFQFFLVEEPEPNAFSIPGGYVVVTTGLLETLDKPEQLAGVLAHEMAHVTEKHVFRQIISSFGPMLIFELVFSGDSSRSGAVSDASSLLIVQSFSQEYEFEADKVGWKYLLAARINPRGMIEMLQRLKAYEDGQGDDEFMPGALSSHPATAKRIKRLESKWKGLKEKEKSRFVDLGATEPKPLNP